MTKYKNDLKSFRSDLLRPKLQTVGIFLYVFSRPIRDITVTRMMTIQSKLGNLSSGNDENIFLKELVNDCRISIKPLFFPSDISECNQKGFLITGQVPDYFGEMSLQSITLGEFCDRWGNNLKQVYGTETCGYKPSYSNPRTMLLCKFLEAEKNNKVMWHE